MKSLLKTVFITFVFLTICCGTLKAQAEDNSRGYVVAVGDLAPDFITTLNNGEKFKLSEHRGKVVMLQFTASWCGVCRKEMPFIESEIWQELKNKNFVLLGVDRDEPLEKVNEFAKQTNITYPLGLDPDGAIFEKYAVKNAGITRNVIIDGQGKIIYLTRLFNREEFDEMKKVLFESVKQ